MTVYATSFPPVAAPPARSPWPEDLLARLADDPLAGAGRIVAAGGRIAARFRHATIGSAFQPVVAARGGGVVEAGLATPNIGLLTDLVSCPGGDFCAQANARSIPVAQAIQERFDDLEYLHDIGEIELNISGRVNSCGHHHVGHIGILGVDKHGEEWYQVTIGGSRGDEAAIGAVIGPSVPAAEVPEVIARLIETYLDHRHEDERFIDTARRIGLAPFQRRAYAAPQTERKAANA